MDAKSILITGASKGIGRYLSEYFVGKGMMVFGIGRTNSDFQDVNYHHFICDVSLENEVKNVFTKIKKQTPKLDILINNAGVASLNHCLLTPIESVNKLFSTNFNGTFLFSREAAKWMQKYKSGRIVNFSTVAVPLFLEGEAIYSASKSAVETLTKVMSKELGGFGITVNCIGPSPIETNLIRTVPKEKIQEIINLQSIKRFAELEDIANVVEFFIKEESSFITGQTIYLGGII